jgi:hypothetical protein
MAVFELDQGDAAAGVPLPYKARGVAFKHNLSVDVSFPPEVKLTDGDAETPIE